MLLILHAAIILRATIASSLDSTVPVWVRNRTIQTLIGAIFEPVDNVDIVISTNTTRRGEQIEYLVGRQTRVLGLKSIRIYEQAFFEECQCTIDWNEPDGVDQLSNPFDFTEGLNVIDFAYGEDFDSISWDQSYDTFSSVWQQNQYDGYVFLGRLKTFEHLMKCLLDPAGRYLVIIAEDENVRLEELLRLLKLVWNNHGVHRLFFLREDKIFTFDPFALDGPSYGVLIEVTDYRNVSRQPRTNFNGYPLNIEMFHSTYSEAVVGTNGEPLDFEGVDVIVSQVIAQMMNFTLIRIQPDSHLFGYRQANGSFNGAIGRLNRHQCDIAFVGFFVKHYLTRSIELTAAVYTDELCCLVIKARRIPEYLLPFAIFPVGLWGLLALMGIVYTSIWMIIQMLLTREFRTTYALNASKACGDMSLYCKAFQMCIDIYVLVVGAPLKRLTLSTVERMLLSSILTVSLIFVFMFQSGLASVFFEPIYYKDIMSLQQLDQSGMRISVKYTGFMDVFSGNYSPMMKSLHDKLDYRPINGSMLEQVVQLGTIATVTRRTTLSLDNAHYLSTKQLHMIPECPRKYNLAYAVPRHSILLDQLNTVLLRMLGGGLINHWIDEMYYNVTVRNWWRMREVHETRFKVLTVVDMQFPFYLLGIGMLLSVGVFIIEVLYFFWRQRRVLWGCYKRTPELESL